MLAPHVSFPELEDFCTLAVSGLALQLRLEALQLRFPCLQLAAHGSGSLEVSLGEPSRGRQEDFIQKNPRVRKIRVRDSGAGNGCTNFMDAWKKLRSFCRKTSMSIKFLVFWGGIFWVFGGGKC